MILPLCLKSLIRLTHLPSMLSISTLHQSVCERESPIGTVFTLGPLSFPLAVSTFYSSSLSSCPLLSPPCSNGLLPSWPWSPAHREANDKHTAVLWCVLTGTGWGVALCFWSVLVTAFLWIKWITEHPSFSCLCTWLHNLKPIFCLMLPTPAKKEVHFSKGHLLQKLYSSKEYT